MTPLHRAWTDGVIQGLREYAWTGANGVEYVGHPLKTTLTTLNNAIAKAESVWMDESDLSSTIGEGGTMTSPDILAEIEIQNEKWLDLIQNDDDSTEADCSNQKGVSDG